MKVLILEDSERAAAALAALAGEAVQPEQVDVVIAPTVVDAKNAVLDVAFDVALIDIVVPMRKDGEPRKDGGLKLLDFILTSPNAKRPRYVVGITSERALLETANVKFRQALFTVLERSPESTAWEDELSRFFSYVAHNSRLAAEVPRPTTDPVSLAIVCALDQPEMEAVRRRFDLDWSEIRSQDDPNSYQIGILDAASGPHRILLAAAHEPGMPCAAALAMKTLCRFKPAVIAMCGITAGVRTGLNMGDILIAEHTWDYTTGKIVEAEGNGSGVLPENRGIRCDPRVIDQARRLATDQELLDNIRRGFTGVVPQHSLSAYLGPLASGGAVVENLGIVESIRARDRKTIGLDMEAHGVATAAWYAMSPRPAFLVAKSVVDRALPPKTDEWHRYAAYTSASFLYAWASRFL